MTDTDVLNKRRKFGTSDEVTENFDAIAFTLKFWCNRSGDASSIMDGFFSVRLKQHPSCCHPIGQNWPHKRAHYRDKEVIQPEAKHRALFVPQQNILPSVTPHFW